MAMALADQSAIQSLCTVIPLPSPWQAVKNFSASNLWICTNSPQGNYDCSLRRHSLWIAWQVGGSCGWRKRLAKSPNLGSTVACLGILWDPVLILTTFVTAMFLQHNQFMWTVFSHFGVFLPLYSLVGSPIFCRLKGQMDRRCHCPRV